MASETAARSSIIPELNRKSTAMELFGEKIPYFEELGYNIIEAAPVKYGVSGNSFVIKGTTSDESQVIAVKVYTPMCLESFEQERDAYLQLNAEGKQIQPDDDYYDDDNLPQWPNPFAKLISSYDPRKANSDGLTNSDGGGNSKDNETDVKSLSQTDISKLYRPLTVSDILLLNDSDLHRWWLSASDVPAVDDPDQLSFPYLIMESGPTTAHDHAIGLRTKAQSSKQTLPEYQLFVAQTIHFLLYSLQYIHMRNKLYTSVSARNVICLSFPQGEPPLFRLINAECVVSNDAELDFGPPPKELELYLPPEFYIQRSKEKGGATFKFDQSCEAWGLGMSILLMASDAPLNYLKKMKYSNFGILFLSKNGEKEVRQWISDARSVLNSEQRDMLVKCLDFDPSKRMKLPFVNTISPDPLAFKKARENSRLRTSYSVINTGSKESIVSLDSNNNNNNNTGAESDRSTPSPQASPRGTQRGGEGGNGTGREGKRDSGIATSSVSVTVDGGDNEEDGKPHSGTKGAKENSNQGASNDHSNHANGTSNGHDNSNPVGKMNTPIKGSSPHGKKSDEESCDGEDASPSSHHHSRKPRDIQPIDQPPNGCCAIV